MLKVFFHLNISLKGCICQYFHKVAFGNNIRTVYYNLPIWVLQSLFLSLRDILIILIKNNVAENKNMYSRRGKKRKGAPWAEGPPPRKIDTMKRKSLCSNWPRMVLHYKLPKFNSYIVHTFRNLTNCGIWFTYTFKLV